jgi:hypothetical protein
MTPQVADWGGKVNAALLTPIMPPRLQREEAFLSVLEENTLYLDPNDSFVCHMGDDRSFWIGQVVN